MIQNTRGMAEAFAKFWQRHPITDRREKSGQ